MTLIQLDFPEANRQIDLVRLKIVIISASMAEIYIIGGNLRLFYRTSSVQRLVVSASGNVTEKLEDGPHLPVDTVFGASTVMDNSQTIITLIGGYAWLNGSVRYDLVWILVTQHTSPNWTRGPDLITGRFHHCTCRLGAIIYVIGGEDSNNTKLSSVEMLDTSQLSPEWTQTQDYPPHVYGQACVVFGDEVWVSGGRTPSGLTKLVYSWNSTTWQARPSMIQVRGGHGMVMKKAKLWVISGESTTSVELYENNAWHVVSSLPEIHYYGISVLYGNNVIQMAGFIVSNSSHISDRVYIMDIITGKWSFSSTTISQAVFYPAVALVIP